VANRKRILIQVLGRQHRANTKPLALARAELIQSKLIDQTDLIRMILSVQFVNHVTGSAMRRREILVVMPFFRGDTEKQWLADNSLRRPCRLGQLYIELSRGRIEDAVRSIAVRRSFFECR